MAINSSAYAPGSIIELYISSAPNMVNKTNLNQNDIYDTMKSNYQFKLLRPILYDPSLQSAMIGLKSWVIPVGFYTINDTNNKLIVTVDDVSMLIEVTLGGYTTADLLTTLISKLLLAFPTVLFRATYKPITNGFLFEALNTVSSISFDLSISNNLHTALGFSEHVYQFTAIYPNMVLVSEYSIDIMTIKILDLAITNYNFIESLLDGLSSSVLYRHEIRVGRNQLDYISFPAVNFKRINSSGGLLDIFNIRITDQFGKLIDFRNNNWYMTIYITFIPIVSISNQTPDEIIRSASLAVQDNTQYDFINDWTSVPVAQADKGVALAGALGI